MLIAHIYLEREKRSPRACQSCISGCRSVTSDRPIPEGGLAMVPPLNFAQAPLEKSALGVIGDQRERSRIALRRFRRASEAAQQTAARGMHKMTAREIASGCERAHEGE